MGALSCQNKRGPFRILFDLHEGMSLDSIIAEISADGETGLPLYADTDAFEDQCFFGTDEPGLVFWQNMMLDYEVFYEFIPMSVDNYSRGICRKKTHDVNWGFVISQGKYVISDFDQSLYVFIETEDRHIDAKVFEIQKLSSKEMTLLLKDSGKILKFRK